VLSEIEASCQVKFLDYARLDVDDDSNYDDDDDDEQRENCAIHSNYIVLYMLWRSQDFASAELYMKEIERTVDYLMDVVNMGHDDSGGGSFRKSSSQSMPHIYLVVDKMSPAPALLGESNMEVQHVLEAKTAEDLARLVAKDPILRERLEGISVGVTDKVRAAPGLSEAVLSIVTYGSRDRRKYSRRCTVETQDSVQKSVVTVVTLSEDDFLGLDPERETDAVQGIDQSIAHAEWNGLGDYELFSKRAHAEWRKKLDFDLVCLDDSDCLFSVENMSTVLAVTVLILSLAHVWNSYREELSFCFKCLSRFFHLH